MTHKFILKRDFVFNVIYTLILCLTVWFYIKRFLIDTVNQASGQTSGYPLGGVDKTLLFY